MKRFYEAQPKSWWPEPSPTPRLAGHGGRGGSPNGYDHNAKEIANGVRYKLCKYLVTARMH
jgi:hypothetical protein